MEDLNDLVAAARQPEPEPGISKATDQELIGELQNRGHRVILEKGHGEGHQLIPVSWSETDTFKMAVISDTHLGSKHQQLTHLNTFLEKAAERDCQFIIHCGDVVDGSHKAHKDIIYEQFVHGYDAQVDYAVAHLPKSGLQMYAINGNHDDWYKMDAGANVCKAIAKERDDFTYLGDRGAHLWLDKIRAYLWHPRGGTGYARSYAMQNWVRDCNPQDKPELLFAGHWHVRSYLPNYQGVWAFQVPCFQATTPFIRTIAKSAEVGAWIVEVGVDKKGRIGRLVTEEFTYEPVHADY